MIYCQISFYSLPIAFWAYVFALEGTLRETLMTAQIFVTYTQFCQNIISDGRLSALQLS